MQQHLVAPSILSADFARLHEAVELINSSDADWVHVDVMDGRFVPNITFGFPVIRDIKPLSKKPLDVHLMIVEPEQYIEDFKKAGADQLSVHIEASPNLHRTIQGIKAAGIKAGVAINPHTPVGHLEDVMSDLDLVVLMSVNPGYGGQKFIENTYAKLQRLVELKKATGSHALIEIDGGVGTHNAEKLVALGANALVAGNAIFGAEDPLQVISTLKKTPANTIEI